MPLYYLIPQLDFHIRIVTQRFLKETVNRAATSFDPPEKFFLRQNGRFSAVKQQRTAVSEGEADLIVGDIVQIDNDLINAVKPVP
jgi:hypothetical protein